MAIVLSLVGLELRASHVILHSFWLCRLPVLVVVTYGSVHIALCLFKVVAVIGVNCEQIVHLLLRTIVVVVASVEEV